MGKNEGGPTVETNLPIFCPTDQDLAAALPTSGGPFVRSSFAEEDEDDNSDDNEKAEEEVEEDNDNKKEEEEDNDNKYN